MFGRAITTELHSFFYKWFCVFIIHLHFFATAIVGGLCGLIVVVSVIAIACGCQAYIYNQRQKRYSYSNNAHLTSLRCTDFDAAPSSPNFREHRSFNRNFKMRHTHPELGMVMTKIVILIKQQLMVNIVSFSFTNSFKANV